MTWLTTLVILLTVLLTHKFWCKYRQHVTFPTPYPVWPGYCSLINSWLKQYWIHLKCIVKLCVFWQMISKLCKLWLASCMQWSVWTMESSSFIRSRSMCHMPSSRQPNNCSLRQTVSDGQLQACNAGSSEQAGLEQQTSNWKLSERCKRTLASYVTDSKPDQQLYCLLSLQMALLQEKVDQQYKVLSTFPYVSYLSVLFFS